MFLLAFGLVQLGLRECTFSTGTDCSGDDLVKYAGPTAQTKEHCCSLCESNPDCKVAVLAVDPWHNGTNQCLLKSGCSHPVGNSNRIKCCETYDDTCTAPAPPPPNVWSCDRATNPVFCDHTKDADTRVAALVASLTLEEKVSQVGSNTAPGIGRLGIPAYQWWGEALHGVCKSPSVNFQPPTPYGTSFPEPGLTAGSFNPTLFSEVGQTIGTEGRAMANAGNSGLTYWAPNINIVRDPRWGRLQETPGECPFLTSVYAMKFVKGVQGNDTFWLQATSTCKHYASYNLDNWHGMDRYHFNAIVNKQDWADTYSQPFQACVEGAQASGIMCSYNAMNGVPTCASPDLIQTLAREKWGFDGYLAGDCGAAEDVWTAHAYGGSAEGAVAESIRAGLDNDCGSFVGKHGVNAVQNCTNCTGGPLAVADLDKAVAHLFRLRLRLGYFDPPTIAPYGNKSYTAVNYTAHFQKALQAAREGITVLVNKNMNSNNNGNNGNNGGAGRAASPSPTLPFSRETIKSVAVIGPNADNGPNMQGVDCHGVPPYLITPRDAFANFTTQVNYAQGCSIGKKDTSGFADATAAVAKSDAVVMVMGLDPSIEYEMRDRTNLLLPGSQPALVAAVKKAAGNKPVVLVLMTGGVLDVTEQLAAGVDAVIWCGYPGQSGGQALAEVVFGAVPPSGRTPLTWYKNEDFADGSKAMVNMFDMGMRPNKTSNNPGRTYRFFSGETLYNFGHGLQYTTFDYSHFTAAGTVTAAAINKVVTADTRGRYTSDPLVTLSITVTNTGTSVGSDHSVLFYATPPTAGTNGDPLKSLVGFGRTGILAPGQSATVTVMLTAWELSLADPTGMRGARQGAWTVVANGEGKVGGGAAGGASASATVTVQ